eukprot:gb/GECG01009084.1/.p1 GENE.gb/GECG01009084.1/~~gb/GECG01009084.1/.p1  ORF type:complete len:545 (+),score=100.07 gb/GECG01009084.1/:1-1635(+)
MSQSEKGTGKMRIKVKTPPKTSSVEPGYSCSSSYAMSMSMNGVEPQRKVNVQEMKSQSQNPHMDYERRVSPSQQVCNGRDTTALTGTLSSLGLGDESDDTNRLEPNFVKNEASAEDNGENAKHEQEESKFDLSTMLSTLDRALVQACRQERDRKWMLLVEQEFKELLRDSNKRNLEYQSLTSYHRLILHRMCDWYGLQRQTLKNSGFDDKQDQQRKGKGSNTHHGLRVFRSEASTFPSFSLAHFMDLCEQNQVVWETLGEMESASPQSSPAGLKIKSREFVPRESKQRGEHPAAIRCSGPADLQQKEIAYNFIPRKKGFAATDTTSPVRAALQERLERPGTGLNQGSIKIKQRATAKSPNSEEGGEGKEENSKNSDEGPAVVLRKEASYEEMRAKIFEKEELQHEEEQQYGTDVPNQSGTGGFVAEGMLYQPPQQAFPVHQNMQGMNQMYYPWMGFQGQPTYMSDSPYDMGVGEENMVHQAPYYNHLSMQQHQVPYGGIPEEGLNNLAFDMNQASSAQSTEKTGEEVGLLWQPHFSESHTSSSA